MKKDRTDTILSVLLAAAAVLFFCLLLLRSYAASQTMGRQYAFLKNADLSQPVSDTIYYDDKFYAMLGYGIEVTPDMPDRQAFLDNWLEASVSSIDVRILSVGCVYTLALGTLLAYPVYRLCGSDRRKHIPGIVLSTAAAYLLYLLFVRIFHAVFGIPFFFPRRYLLLAGVSVLSIIGGLCALGLLLRGFRYKKLAALAAIPLAAVLFLTGFVTEVGLFLPEYEESFAYLGEIDPSIYEEGYEGDIYYDPERNVMVWEGKEYPPQLIENPDRFRGPVRAAALLYETVNPVSGNQLAVGESTGEYSVPAPALAAYSVKALLWILLPLFLHKRSG